MPADLQQHIRYPEDLFLVQAQLSSRLDTWTRPRCSANREDLWQFPRQAAGIDSAGNCDVPRVAPYYTIMRLPG